MAPNIHAFVVKGKEGKKALSHGIINSVPRGYKREMKAGIGKLYSFCLTKRNKIKQHTYKYRQIFTFGIQSGCQSASPKTWRKKVLTEVSEDEDD